MIDKIDGEYIDVLESLGITKEEIDSCNLRKNYESIARKLQIIFTKDVIMNSSKSGIRMSEDVAKAMHTMRNINNSRIVNYAVLQEDNTIYPRAIRSLMINCAKIVLDDDNLEKMREANVNDKFAGKLISMYENTPYEGFTRYISEVNPDEYVFTKKIVYESTRQAIEVEQAKAREIVLSREEFTKISGFPNKNKRICGYVNYYRNKGITEEYSEADIQKDIEDALKVQETRGENGRSILEEKFALEFGARYLASLNDIEFFKLLQDSKLVTEDEARSLTRRYKDIGQAGIKKEVYEHKEFIAIMNEQKEETEKVDDKGIEI